MKIFSHENKILKYLCDLMYYEIIIVPGIGLGLYYLLPLSTIFQLHR